MTAETTMENEKAVTVSGRDLLLATAKRRYREVSVPDVGTFRIRNLSAGEGSTIEAETYADNKKREGSGIAKWKSRYIAAAVVDDNGHRLFGIKDIDTIQSFDKHVVDALYDAIAEHCGIETDKNEALEKNSETTHDACLLTD